MVKISMAAVARTPRVDDRKEIIDIHEFIAGCITSDRGTRHESNVDHLIP